MSTTTQRPTPETDAAIAGSKWAVDADFARKLERERDELAAKLVANEAYQAGLLAERDESREQLEVMREAIKDAHYALAYVYNHGAGSCAFPFRTEDDLCSENRFHHVKDALDKLKPFIKL